MSDAIENLANDAGYVSGFTDFGPDGSGAAWVHPTGQLPTLLKRKWAPVLDAFAKAAGGAHQRAEEAERHLVRAYEVWTAANFNEDGRDRHINATRFHDLLGMEAGAHEWPDAAFLGDFIDDPAGTDEGGG